MTPARRLSGPCRTNHRRPERLGWRWALPCALLAAALASPGQSQETGRPLSFEAASEQMERTSHTLGAAGAAVGAARDDADALKALRRPVVSLDVQDIEYQKTLDLSLKDLKSDAQGSIDSALNQLTSAAGGLGGAGAAVVGQVVSRVESALPDLFAQIPNSLSTSFRQNVFRPTATAVLPIYTGGAIPALQGAAQAGVDEARAQQASTRDLLRLDLVRAYFGQVLAVQALAISRDTRDGFDRHLFDAKALEAQGAISHARVLEVQVARDAAQRQLERATGQYETARSDLAGLLQAADAVALDTPLFVNAAPAGPLQPMIDTALDHHPSLRKADAMRAAAVQGVNLARSRELPSVYVFGEYNMDHHDELPTEPDWAVGVGLHYTLLSNIDRAKSLSAAKQRERAADEGLRQARVQLETDLTRAYELTETARREYLTLDSSLASARENLRVQTAAFREGEATSVELIDARNLLGQTRTERAAAAYAYDLALASLLTAEGQTETFVDYIRRADRVVAPEGPALPQEAIR
ncbi:MAG: TolC family protein [Caulobacteraceae bacterium]